MSLRDGRDKRRRRVSGERGGSAVEAALVTPVVMALVFGIIEMGFLFKDNLAIAGAVRAGVRIASANPRNATFAQKTADKVARTGGAANLNDVTELWVYKVAAGTDKPEGFTTFANCTVCVKFRWDGAKFVLKTGGGESWSAMSQNACSSVSVGGPPDRIGVYLKLRHQPFTGLVFSNSIYLSEASILTLEPMPVSGGCK
jgi:Flp pilus assembly protein TadG